MMIKKLQYIVIATLVVIANQNCSQTRYSGVGTATPSQSGNGESYTGKITYYAYQDPDRVCTQKTASGKPFPTRQVFQQADGFYLVRDKCQDVEPMKLKMGEFTYDPATDKLVYQGVAYTTQADLSDYNTVPLVCPPGRSVVSNSPRNYYADPLNLSALSWVSNHPTIPAVLDGSLSALPRYLIQVTTEDQDYLFDWNRVAQSPSIERNTDYAVSFVLQRGSLSKAIFRYDEGGGHYTGVGVDLAAGGAWVTYSLAMPDPKLDMRPYGRGYLLTVFLTSSRTVSKADTGVAPWRGNLTDTTIQRGDSIYATVAGFRKVSDYCSP